MTHLKGRPWLPAMLVAVSGLLLVAGTTESNAADEDKGVEQLIEQGKTDEVAALLKKKPWLAKRPHKFLDTAARAGRTPIVQLLLERGADPNLDYVISNVRGPYTPLSSAVTAGHFESARLLCKYGADVDASAGKNHDSLFHYAVAYLEPRFVKLLLEQKADVNRSDERGLTPLHIAADRGEIAKAQLLLDFKANINAETKDGATPLFFAMVQGHPDFCQFLLEHGARLDVYSACGLGKQREAIALVEAKPGLTNAPDRRLGRTPLFWAVRNGAPGLVEWLLNHGAEVNVRAPSIMVYGNVVAGPTVWDKALPKGRGVTPLHEASDSESTEAVRLLLKKGADPNAQDERGRTPLQRALRHQHAEIVKLLVKAGANVDAKDDLGSLPLCGAIGDTACMKILIGARADVNAADKHQGPPLLVAAYRDHKEAVDLLLTAGAKLDFHSACLLGRVRDLERFLKENPRLVDSPVPFESYYGQKPLLLAARAGQAEIVDLLIARGAEDDPTKNRYPSALHVAAMYGRQTVVERLLAKGIPVDSATAEEKGTALFDAVIFAPPEMVRFLLDHKADPRIRISSYTPAQGTPLHCIGARRNAWGPEEDEAGPDLIRRQVAIARMLIDAGADLEAKNGSGATPLHEAVGSGNAELVALLLARGAQVNARDKYYNTPLHYAENGHLDERKHGRTKIAELLRKNGGAE